jgi:hypothetical protein
MPETLHNIMLANGIKGDAYAKNYLFAKETPKQNKTLSLTTL